MVVLQRGYVVVANGQLRASIYLIPASSGHIRTQEHNLLAFKVKILVRVCMDLQIGYCSSKQITQKVSTLKVLIS